jgi:hypothetical protein
MTETERALRAALPGLDWQCHDDGTWTAPLFDQSYAMLTPVGRIFWVRALGDATNRRTLPDAAEWLRAQVATVHARLGVALEGVK